MYQDLYLSFTDEAAANAVLYTTHPVTQNEYGAVVTEEYTTANYINIDTLGILYAKSDDPDAEPIPLNGWHINVRVMPDEDGTPLEPFAVHPSTPLRIWG